MKALSSLKKTLDERLKWLMQMGKVSNLKGSYNSYQMWLTMKYILSLLLIVLLRDIVVTGFMLKDYWNRIHATNINHMDT